MTVQLIRVRVCPPIYRMTDSYLEERGMMSLSSGSDITIPIQDSPPPPPSPYANRVGESGKKMTPEPLGDVTTGIENKGYQPHDGDSGKKMKKNSTGSNGSEKYKDHTEINMTPAVVGNGKVNEAINPELINMSVMGTIPAKPQSEFGPYEQMDDYFIPVNQHKKFLSRRSEKLYVTKDKRKSTNWKRYLCWTLAVFFLAAIAAVGILAAVGVINFPVKTGDGTFDQIFVTSTIGTVMTSTAPPSTTRASTTPIDPENNYVPMSADVEFHIQNRKFEAALANKSSEMFQQLATEVQDKMKDLLKERTNLENAVVRVHEFNPGSVYVKLRIGWMDESMEFNKIQMNLANVTEFGGFEVMQMKSFNVANLCKFNKNNGCSHSCAYDYDLLEFICTCPESMTLSSDKKTCEAEPIAEPESPSSEEPSAEPETSSAAPETSSSEPQPEATPAEEESTEAPAVVSSSVAPEEEIPIVSSSSTTPESRSESIDEEVPPTTDAPQTDTEENKEELPSSSTTTSTTTTEAPIASVSESEDKLEPNPSVEPMEAVTETPEESQDEILAHSDELHPREPVESKPFIPVVETTTENPSADDDEVSATESLSAADHDNPIEHPISPVEILDMSSTTSTTTTTTEATAAAVNVEEESPVRAEEPVNSNLQREESAENINSRSNFPPVNTSSLETNPDVEVLQTNSSSSSERNGRHENFSETKPLSSGEDEVTTLPSIGQNGAVIPNSGEFMVYSDNQPAHSSSQQQTSTEAAVSKEKLSLGSGSDEIPSSASAEADTGAAEVQVNRETEEQATEVPAAVPIRTFIGDTDVNHLDNVTEDTVNSEQIHGSKPAEADGRDIAAIGNQDDLPGATHSPLTSSEELDEVEPNRDHLIKGDEVDTTLGPIVLDVNESADDQEEVTTTAPEISTTTSTTPAPPTLSTSAPSSNNSAEESENELS